MTDGGIKKALGWGGWLAVAWIGLIVAAGVLGPLLPLQDPQDQSPCTTRQPERKLDDSGEPVVVDGRYVLIPQEGCPAQTAADDAPGARPSARHIFGTDQIGRDMLSRIVSGARTSLIVAVGGTLTAIVLGGLLGATLAFVGGWVDKVVTGLLIGIVAMPAIVVAISVVTGVGRGVFSVWLALSVIGVPGVAVLARSQALSIVTREYVTAATMFGARRARVLFREVIPNLVPLAFTYVGLGIAIAIGAEGALAVLGLSVQDPATSWGAMINDGRSFLERNPHICLIPTVVLFLTVWSATRISDAARTHFDVRESLL